ncbi:MAG TPA: hypothetical protein VMU03_17835 [Gammaproteobacteria bacterium]|nr:hypothetical protein [Gammaproteobacteria bacterium]
MRLPHADEAYIDRKKITAYLLCSSHPDGYAKARFFFRFGFTIKEWRRLADALKAVAASNVVVAILESTHGVRYTVDGLLQAPDGRTPKVRTVWIIEQGRTAPRLVTAHPL